ncbi:cholecystokinin-like [Menidia menidia]
MSAGLCVCVLLAVLCTTCLGLPVPPSDSAAPEALSGPRPRSGRSSPQLKVFPGNEEQEAESRANLSELLARLISTRKASVRRNSTAKSRVGGPSSHRIADRDYLGWMDFGRRSAEEYEEYSS